MTAAEASTPNLVRKFRQIFLWPLQLVQARGRGTPVERCWEELLQRGNGAWERAADVFAGDSSFEDRHYAEFITFMPYVQRVLYGDGVPNSASPVGQQSGGSPIRMYRRTDLAQMRVTLDQEHPPVTLGVENVHLYFFTDVDVVILTVEVSAEDLTLRLAQDLLFRNGRAYSLGVAPQAADLRSFCGARAGPISAARVLSDAASCVSGLRRARRADL